MVVGRAHAPVHGCEKSKLDIFFLGPKEFPAVNRCRANGKMHPGLNPKVFVQAASDDDLGHCPAKVETSGFGRSWQRSPRRAWSSARVMRQPPTRTALHAPLCTHTTHTPHSCTGVSPETWFVMMWRAGRKFWGVKFLFFLSLYSVNGMSVIKNKQIENC